MNTDAVHQNQFVTLNGSPAPVLSRLSYVGSEPFAVNLAFRTERGRWVEWTFARELLVTGLSEPAGIGDVRVRPDLATDEDLLILEIESPDGYALVEMEREDVERFLDASAEVVPIGAEAGYFDVDAFIAEITNV
ncbi:SsgA family sporulation/cell division regulator [Amycolatopsis rhizosphaerae]|uniref:SsgA family sporulation/cell division regulator n=1 Tax=Amycolatopsis rhizosphaerae TaxID=2053003 RepID=A0A558A8S2_9PSEU|nr:SsgA family sporulation/cell division regulator [Amycolatopsis rhizosphaerae]TVT20664.1 SsgA family sporulation/cell division regulator [Amycolatopsis rhizosphaerae]